MAVLSATMILGACKADLTDVEYVARAKEHQDKGDLRSGIVDLKNALQKNPENLEARWLLGEIYVEIGDGAAAEKELRRAMELGVAREAVVIPLAKALLLQNKPKELLADSSILNSLPPEDKTELHTLRGQAYLALDQLDEATAELQAAFLLQEDSPHAQFGQALLAITEQQYDQARQWLNKVLETDPKYAQAWSLLGDIEAAEEQLELAQEAYGKAIELRQYETMDYIKRAVARLRLGDLAGAGEDIRVLKKIGFQHFFLSHIEGVVDFHNKRYEAAQNAFQQSLNLQPSYLPAKTYLAATHLIRGQTEQALRLAEQLRYELPNSTNVQRLLGDIYLNRSEFAQASAVLEQLLTRLPDDTRALGLMGTIALAEGRSADGVGYFQKVVALEPNSRDAQQMLMVAKLMGGQEIDAVAFGDSQEDQYEEHFLSALSKFKQGNYEQALELARRVHESKPDEVDPRNLMAACHLALGDWDKARIELEKVLEMAPNNPSAVKNLAKIEMTEGNLDRASDLLEKFLVEHPDDREAVALLAQTETRRGNEAKAIQVLEQAVQRNPDESSLRATLAQKYDDAGRIVDLLALTRNLTDKQVREQPSLLALRGKVELQAGNMPSAKQTFARWTAVAPDSAQAHFFYAESLANSGELERAREELKQAVQLDPNYLLARVGEIKMIASLGEKERALEALAKVKQDFGDRPEVLGIEGWLSLLNGDYATAEKSFLAAAEQQPDTELTIYLVRVLWAQEKYDQALQVMRDWLENHPRDLPVLLHLAGGYLSLSKAEEARAMYARVIELYPNHVPALNNLAWLSREKDLKQAIAYAERAYELLPRNPQVADTLGTLLMEGGDQSRGYRLIREAADQSPENPEIQLHLGRALMEQEKFAEAKEVLDALIGKTPDSQFADQAKALLASIPQ